jgi:hypothetical protein
MADPRHEPGREPEHDGSGVKKTATNARQGDIVLRRPWQRVVFIVGLVGIVLAFVIWGLAA